MTSQQIPFHLVLCSAALVELAMSIPVHSLILSCHSFLVNLFFSFHLLCSVGSSLLNQVIEAWPNPQFPFLTRARSSSYFKLSTHGVRSHSSLISLMYQVFRVVLGRAYRGLSGGFLLLRNFSVAISVSPHVCFILV